MDLKLRVYKNGEEWDLPMLVYADDLLLVAETSLT